MQTNSKQYRIQLLKQYRQKLQQKRARLFVRNLSHNATYNQIVEHFSKYGQVENFELLKKDDDKYMRCGFIQFEKVQNAAKARHYLNGSTFMDREILVDFAIPKDKYVSNINNLVKKEEPDIQSEKHETIEVVEDENEPSVTVAEDDDVITESDDGGDVSVPTKQANASVPNKQANASVPSKQVNASVGRTKFESHDVSEGRTVFVKNIPFDAENHDLKECMEQFGPVLYALICIDKLTEHSRGTGFVKFARCEDAEKALSAGTELKLNGQILDCLKAIDRSEITNDAKTEKKPKDSRHLYLIKEGVVMAGSPAAVGVSIGDMTKRLELERYKSQILRNLNRYISLYRLAIHNLPLSWNDGTLRNLVKKHSPAGAVITEAKIMRNLKDIDLKTGKAVSKGYGFVQLSKHEHALYVLRALNNNPKIFSPNKRPIVGFAIEDRAKVKQKEKRLQASKQKLSKSQNQQGANKKVHIPKFSFEGAEAKPGGKNKFRSKMKLQSQAETHHKNVKKLKALAKLRKTRKQTRSHPQPKQQPKNKKNRIDMMVQKHKQSSHTKTPRNKKKKWYM